jgi:hypothetical protein
MGNRMTNFSSPITALEQTGALEQGTGCPSAPVAWPPYRGHTLGLNALAQRGGSTRSDWCAQMVPMPRLLLGPVPVVVGVHFTHMAGLCA